MLVAASVGFVASTPAFADGLSLTATGTVLYDSNILRSLSSSGRSSDDVRYSPAGSAEYTRMLGFGTVGLTGLIGHDFFQNNSYLNRNRFGAGALLNTREGSRCSAGVNGNYTNRQNGIGSDNYRTGVPKTGTSTTPVSVDPTVPVTGDTLPDDVGRLIDNRQIFIVYGGHVSCGLPGGRASFGGAAVRSTLDNGSALRKFANSSSTVYSLFAGVGVLRPGQLQVNGSFSTIDYPNRLVLPGSTISPVGFNTGVKTYRGGLTYSRPIGTKLSGSIGLSYIRSVPDGGRAPFSAPAYDISLSYHPAPRLSFSALGSRSVLSSSSAGALFRVVDTFQLTTNYDVSDTISARANAGFISNNYQQPFAIPGEPLRRSDTSKIAGAGVTYAPRSLYDLSLQLSETFRSSKPSIYDYNSTRVSLTLSVHV